MPWGETSGTHSSGGVVPVGTTKLSNEWSPVSGVLTVTLKVTVAVSPAATVPVIVNTPPVIGDTVRPEPLATAGGVVTVASSSTRVRSSV